MAQSQTGAAPVFIRAWRSLFWKIATHKFHSYYKKEGFSYMMKEKEVSALYQKKKGESVVPILQKICQWSGIFYREDSENVMTQCQKCDYR